MSLHKLLCRRENSEFFILQNLDAAKAIVFTLSKKMWYYYIKECRFMKGEVVETKKAIDVTIFYQSD